MSAFGEDLYATSEQRV